MRIRSSRRFSRNRRLNCKLGVFGEQRQAPEMSPSLLIRQRRIDEFYRSGNVAGVLGALAMDALNPLFSRAGLLTKIDVAMIGRMAAGWTHGRFRYGHPGELAPVTNEAICGYLAHFAIGVALAVPFLHGWDLLVGGPASPLWALAYGLATTAASWFFVYPRM